MSENSIKLVTKYEQIEKLIRERIRSGSLRPGDKLDSEYALAEQLGVHRFTVNKAIGNLVRQDLLFRVQGKGTFVCEPLPDSLTGSYGVLFSGSMQDLLSNDFYSRVLAGMRDGTDKDLLVLGGEGVAGTGGPDLEKVSWEKVDGVLVLEVFEESYYERLRARGKPFVVVDYEAPGMADERVVLDNFAGGYQATRHLIELGHERIAHIGETPDRDKPDPAWQDRRKGYEHALAEAGLPLRAEYFFAMARRNAVASERAAEVLFGLDEPPTAVVCADDGIGATFIRRGSELGRTFPADCSIVGFGDGRIATLVSPPMTTVRADLARMGRLAVERLAARIANPTGPGQRTVVPVELLARDSTAPVGKA